MWFLTFMSRLFVPVLVFFLFLPFSVNAAEVLQVRSSSLILVGDQNRSYTIRLACLDVSAEHEDVVVEFLKSELPRRKRINFMPLGSEEGILIARVIPFGNGIDLSEEIISSGLGSSTCID